MVLQVCASAVELVCAPARSLWPTLASAASTLALFAVANWGFSSFLDDETSTFHLMLQILVAFTVPLSPLKVCFGNALQVWTVKRTIQKGAAVSAYISNIMPESIAILCTCPLYLQVPSSAISSTVDEELLDDRGYTLVAGDPKEFCPMELAPSWEAAAAIGDPPATILNTDHDNEKKYLRFPGNNAFTNSNSLKEREMLLTLGLAPEYSQLRFLRSRSSFQAVVTALQAAGYVLSVVQRLAQHLAVCPLEALLCFLSVIVILQLLLELYACSRYQRPLLLRLNHQQFSQFWGAPRRDDTEICFNLERFLSTVLGLLSLPFSALSMYYSVHYMHSCPVCSVAALLFFFALLFCTIGLIIHTSRTDGEKLGFMVIFVSPFMFLTSMVLAVVSTAKDWDLFHSPTNNSFSWILPHVSSQA